MSRHWLDGTPAKASRAGRWLTKPWKLWSPPASMRRAAGPVVALGGAVIEGFVGGLQPHLVAFGPSVVRDFQFGQGGHVVQGQFPGLAAVVVGLRAEVAVEAAGAGPRPG